MLHLYLVLILERSGNHFYFGGLQTLFGFQEVANTISMQVILIFVTFGGDIIITYLQGS